MIISVERVEPKDNRTWCTARLGYIWTFITVLNWKTSNDRWHDKNHLELFISDEKLPFYAYRDINNICAYGYTPATAKLAMADANKQVHLVTFSFLPKKQECAQLKTKATNASNDFEISNRVKELNSTMNGIEVRLKWS